MALFSSKALITIVAAACSSTVLITEGFVVPTGVQVRGFLRSVTDGRRMWRLFFCMEENVMFFEGWGDGQAMEFQSNEANRCHWVLIWRNGMKWNLETCSDFEFDEVFVYLSRLLCCHGGFCEDCLFFALLLSAVFDVPSILFFLYILVVTFL